MSRRWPLVTALCVVQTRGFAARAARATGRAAVTMSETREQLSAAHLRDPKSRDSCFGSFSDGGNGNVAQFLVDLHDNKGIFDFCGGMPFQLVLTEKLRGHLARVAAGEEASTQPVVFDASKRRMSQIPGYSKTPDADNVNVFHGREIRQVDGAAGGMGMVLQLSHSEGDPEGWTPAEVEGYDGWVHDSGRTWRKGPRLEQEGFAAFRKMFGGSAFALHHRFYLHFDGRNQLWLSAEDGCEGEPAQLGR